MARLDGTGPRGSGPMTGKTRGYCVGNISERPIYGRGIGQKQGIRQNSRRRGEMNRGLGRCMADRFNIKSMRGYYVEDAEYLLDSKQSLEEEKNVLEERLNKINEELENSNDR